MADETGEFDISEYDAGSRDIAHYAMANSNSADHDIVHEDNIDEGDGADEYGFAAAHAVLDTAELLENILLNLDMQTLLLSQRVSKTFKAIIRNSMHLQRALWFQPMPQQELAELKDKDRVNPLISYFRKNIGIEDMLSGVEADYYPDYTHVPKHYTKCTYLGFDNIKRVKFHFTAKSWWRMIPFQVRSCEEDLIIGTSAQLRVHQIIGHLIGSLDIRDCGAETNGGSGVAKKHVHLIYDKFRCLTGRSREMPTMGDIFNMKRVYG